MTISEINQNGSMRIAYDAKRAFQNGTGLGHYSRTLLQSLATEYPQHQYYLCAPKLTTRFNYAAYANMHAITPSGFASKLLPALWRSRWVTPDLVKLNLDVYHGLSHEIPSGINNTNIKTVVTIHDLIFERYPHQYKWADVQIYRRKFKYACENAHHIIAISQQTKADIMQYYHIPEQKITVCYQSCNPLFAQKITEQEKERVRALYHLPPAYYLYVGSIIERKNLLNICKAYALAGNALAMPLVVVGDGGRYKKQVMAFVEAQQLQQKIIFLSETTAARNSAAFQSATVFPAIYQMAAAMVYPSVFEGFGIPVLEAMWSGTPVITSNLSCLPETGGDAALYVDPYSPQQIADALLRVQQDPALAADMRKKGYLHAIQFTPAKCAAAVMQVYLRL